MILATAAAGVAVAGPALARSAPRLEGIPHYDHVFTIVLENENYAATWDTPGPTAPTFLRDLRKQGAFVDQYYGTGHVSADNYIAMTSGQLAPPLFNGDCIASWAACEGSEKVLPDGGRSIADQVEADHLTWKAYMDSMTTSCQHPSASQMPDPYQTGYATRHDPFVYYPPIVENASRCNSHVVAYTGLAQDLQRESTTPNYVFITPDTCHDGHDSPCSGVDASQPGAQQGGLVSADDWLAAEVPKILHSKAFTTPGVNSLLVITFDENGFSDLPGCCGVLARGGVTTTDAALGGRIGLLALGHGITPGTLVHTPYDHWSYLRTVEDALGISEHLNLAGAPTTAPMTGLFR